ncbi:MAG: 4-phosphoerythronate dehydrogenase [Gammaproteobacteria bacterium]
MTIVADENIPGLEHYFLNGLSQARARAQGVDAESPTYHPTSMGVDSIRIVRRPGMCISAADLAQAQVLLVRSVTRVSADLLRHSSVEFVGSCTIGTDHVDLETLAERGIAWSHAPGCNATAVAEYVLEHVMRFCAEQERAIEGLRVGIIGCGTVGRRVAEKLNLFGCKPIVCDPPLQQRCNEQARFSETEEGEALLRAGVDARAFGSLDEVFRCDVVTLHVPLVREGQWPTHHLVSLARLQSMPTESVFINTARGAVVDLQPCMAWRASPAGRADIKRRWIFDVFESEPTVNPEHLSMLHGVTPHIAGHSQLGKEWGTRQVWQQLLAYMRLPVPSAYPYSKPPAECRLVLESTAFTASDWVKLLDQVSGLAATDRQFRAAFASASADELAGRFESLRRQYRPRNELRHTSIIAPHLREEDVLRLRALGVRVTRA